MAIVLLRHDIPPGFYPSMASPLVTLPDLHNPIIDKAEVA